MQFLSEIFTNPTTLILVLTLLAILFLLLLRQALRSAPKEKSMRIAPYINSMKHLTDGRISRAIESLSEVVKRDSDAIDKYFILGKLLRLKGDFDKAIKIHRSILLREKLDDEMRKDTTFNLSLELKKAGKLERAARELEPLIAKDSTNLEYLRLLEDIYLEMNDTEKAYNVRLKISKLEKKSSHNILAHLLVEMGKKAYKKGNYGTAKKLYKKAISLFNSSVDAYYNLAKMYLKEGDYKNAEKSILAIWEVAPKFGFFTTPLLEEIYYNTGRYTEYADFLRSMLKKNPDDYLTMITLAKYYIKTGNMEEGEREIRNALEKRPEDMNAWEVLSDICVKKGDMEGLSKVVKEVLERCVKKKFFSCRKCGYDSDEIFWRCPHCKEWDTVFIST